MGTNINYDEVETALRDIDAIISEMEALSAKIDSDISAGWNSVSAKANVTPKIDDIKSNILAIKEKMTVMHARSANAEGTVRAIDENTK